MFALYEAMKPIPAPTSATAGAGGSASQRPPARTRWLSPAARAEFAQGMASKGSTPAGIAWLLSGD